VVPIPFINDASSSMHLRDRFGINVMILAVRACRIISSFSFEEVCKIIRHTHVEVSWFCHLVAIAKGAFRSNV